MKRKLSLVLLLVACAVALFLLRRPPPVPPPSVPHPTARQLAQAERHLNALVQPGPAPEANTPAKPRTLRLSEQDLNTYLAASPAVHKLLAAHGIQALQVFLAAPDALTVRAAVRVGGPPQNVQIEGALTPDPVTGVRFTASRAQVGRFPLPAPVVTAQANALARRLISRMHRRLPLAVRSVRVEDKTLVLVGLPAPALSPAAASPRSASPARR